MKTVTQERIDLRPFLKGMEEMVNATLSLVPGKAENIRIFFNSEGAESDRGWTNEDIKCFAESSFVKRKHISCSYDILHEKEIRSDRIVFEITGEDGAFGKLVGAPEFDGIEVSEINGFPVHWDGHDSGILVWGNPDVMVMGFDALRARWGGALSCESSRNRHGEPAFFFKLSAQPDDTELARVFRGANWRYLPGFDD